MANQCTTQDTPGLDGLIAVAFPDHDPPPGSFRTRVFTEGVTPSVSGPGRR